MESQVNQEIIKRQMDKMEFFLRQIKAKYSRKEKRIEIYGNVYETAFLYLKKFQDTILKIKIEIEEGKLLDVTPEKGYITLEIWNNGNLKNEIVHSVSDIIILNDTVYIFF